VVIFESTNSEYIEPLCENYSYVVLDIDSTSIVLNRKVAYYFILHFIKTGSIKIAYYSALIESINPNIVVTFIDNSILFSSICKKLHRSYYFLAIQNACRYDVRAGRKEINTRKIFLSNFACFGKYEKELYDQVGAKVLNYIMVGSLREDYFRRYLLALNPKKIENKATIKYDLCLIAESSPNWDKMYPGVESSIGVLAQYTIRYCKENGLKWIIAGKRDMDNGREDFQTASGESLWYKEYIGDAIITPRVKDKYTTYQLVQSSRLSLATVSTALYEGASRGNKVLFCNYSNFRFRDFPVKCIMSLTDEGYEAFSCRVSKILDLSDSEYHKQTEKIIKHVISNDTQSTYDTLKNIISHVVQNKGA
jgi:surface carbohydrate biosynthesis protein